MNIDAFYFLACFGVYGRAKLREIKEKLISRGDGGGGVVLMKES